MARILVASVEQQDFLKRNCQKNQLFCPNWALKHLSLPPSTTLEDLGFLNIWIFFPAPDDGGGYLCCHGPPASASIPLHSKSSPLFSINTQAGWRQPRSRAQQYVWITKAKMIE